MAFDEREPTGENVSDTRYKNAQWKIPNDNSGDVTWDGCKLAVLMDIRDELQRLNNLLRCTNFLAIPRKLDLIARKLPTLKRRRK